MQATLDTKTGKLTIVIDTNTKNPPTSSSGKTKLVAHTSGFQASTVEVNGHPLKINVMATIPA